MKGMFPSYTTFDNPSFYKIKNQKTDYALIKKAKRANRKRRVKK